MTEPENTPSEAVPEKVVVVMTWETTDLTADLERFNLTHPFGADGKAYVAVREDADAVLAVFAGSGG